VRRKLRGGARAETEQKEDEKPADHCKILPVLEFTPELERLRAAHGDAAIDPRIARERREVFSVHPEVRIAAWGGALLLAAAVGLFVKNHFERFDERLIAVALAILAAGCYAWAWRAREARSPAAQYVALLGALVLSADVGFIEEQFNVFGDQGQRHFLVLAVLHGAAAYAFHSNLVLSLSIAALAAWMGLERRSMLTTGIELSMRAFACAAVLLVWRWLDRGRFSRTFEHFAANLMLSGGLALGQELPLASCLTTVVVAALVMAWGFRARAESFVLYAFVYAVVAVDLYAFHLRLDETPVIFVSMLVAVPALVLIHRRFRRAA
jgi:hypothetical protein